MKPGNQLVIISWTDDSVEEKTFSKVDKTTL